MLGWRAAGTLPAFVLLRAWQPSFAAPPNRRLACLVLKNRSRKEASRPGFGKGLAEPRLFAYNSCANSLNEKVFRSFAPRPGHRVVGSRPVALRKQRGLCEIRNEAAGA